MVRRREASTRFVHERLDCYRVALEFLELGQGLARRLPRSKGQAGDQLLRAGESIVLRIAEGVGAESGSGDQRRHFRAAKGSAHECAAVLDVCRVRGVGGPDHLIKGCQLLLRLVKMLAKLARVG